MREIDYNGEGDWSAEEIARRYQVYCRALRIDTRTDLTPMAHTEGATQRVYPVMDKVIAGIEAGDAACRSIGVDFVEQDAKFPFGKTLKSNTARALRRSALTEEERERLRRRFVSMMLRGQVPHEFKEYAKLLRKIGLGEWKGPLAAGVDRENPYVMRYYRYLTEADGE